MLKIIKIYDIYIHRVFIKLFYIVLNLLKIFVGKFLVSFLNDVKKG